MTNQPLAGLIARVPRVWQALIAIAAAGALGWTLRAAWAAQLALPGAVRANTEQIHQVRERVDRVESAMDSVAREATYTRRLVQRIVCYMEAEREGRSGAGCVR